MKWVFALVATVVVLAGAAVVYQLFSAQYTPELLEAQSSKSESTSSASRIKAPDFEAVGLTESRAAFSVKRQAGSPQFLVQQMRARRRWDFQEAYQEYGDQIHFVMVNSIGAFGETEESGRQYLEEQKYTFPACFDVDQEAVMAYGIQAFPTTYFIDADGYIVTGAKGMLTQSNLEKGISMLLPAGE
ncbi:MAG: TlpA family protein disulfide reductase [Hydrogeniiclostridium mannosilyticum]